ncbi:MAG TPA: VOC family protein [Candidatus Angelobacter sp.]|jgi:lactoylglutathione lyase|nr:VOC family protein [Candidatus Angelobacter sp.]
MSLKIATVAIYVEDQKQALKFWTEKVGLTILRSHPVGLDLEWVELSDETPGTCLVLYPRSMMQDWAERKPSIVFECADVQAKYEELSARGVVFTQEPKKLPWGPFAIFMDTEGNWFGLRGEARQ